MAEWSGEYISPYAEHGKKSEQVKKITTFLTANSVKDYGEFYRNVKTDFAYYKPKSVPEM